MGLVLHSALCTCGDCRSDQLVELEGWSVSSATSMENQLRLIFLRYFKALQQMAAASTAGNLANAIAWEVAAEQLINDWEELAQKVILNVGQDQFDRMKLGQDFLLDNPYTKAWAVEHGSELITEISESTREGIQRAIADGVFENETVQDISRDIRPLIGLRDDQMRAVRNFYNAQGAAGYTEDQAAAKAMAYGRKLLNQRCMLIARTEVMTASNEGLMHSWKDAQNKGLILPQSVRVWVTNAGARRTCPICRGFAGKEATLEGVFTSSSGATRKAPPAHPACRCTQGLRTRVMTTKEDVLILLTKAWAPTPL